MDSESIRNICQYFRRKGCTSWILKSALKNPRVVIVAHTERYANDLRTEYLCMLKNRSFFEKFIAFFREYEEPIFVSYIRPEILRGLNRPIVFDNSCFF